MRLTRVRRMPVALAEIHAHAIFRVREGARCALYMARRDTRQETPSFAWRTNNKDVVRPGLRVVVPIENTDLTHTEVCQPICTGFIYPILTCENRAAGKLANMK